jgi:hypothetical protein
MAFTTIVVGRVGPIRIHSAISPGSSGGLSHEAPLGIMKVSLYFRWGCRSFDGRASGKVSCLESRTLLEERP